MLGATARRAKALCLPGLVLSAALLSGAEPEKPEPEAPKVRLWVPAYFYPAGDGLAEWDRLLDGARRGPVVAIVNPDSGPGKKADANYVAVIARARRAGVTLVGYVSTQYGKRPAEAVQADVDAWADLYPTVQGIHFDEQSSAADGVDYYAGLYARAKKKFPGGPVLSNPGTACAAAYLSRPAADAVCLFEGNKGFADFRPPDWAARFPPARVAVIAYQVETAEAMRDHLRAAVRHRAGNVYFTDRNGANPYDRLPTYWRDEVEAVAALNKGKAP